MTQYFVLHPANFKLDGGAMFGIIPKPLWQKKCPADELNRIELALRLLLIKTEKRIILIDSGIGDYHDEKFCQRFAISKDENPIISCLKELDLKAEDVTDLVMTHLHFDHAGGIINKNEHEFIFPNALIHVHRKHWEYALHPTLRDQGSFITEYFKPLIEKMNELKKVNWYEADEGILIKENNYQLNYKISTGHTPYLMHPYDDHIIYMADLVPTSHHVPVAWVMGYDISPGQTTKDKVNFYNLIDSKKLTMIFEHDPKYIAGNLIWKNPEATSQVIENLLTKTQEIKFQNS